MIKLVYAGFDTLTVSFQGALPDATLEYLEEIKAVAEERNERQLVTVGNLEAHLESHGGKGGYAFILDTGPQGEIWTFKNNSDTSQWNIGVDVRAANLVSRTYPEAKAHIYAQLEAMGCIVTGESIRRADFAMDFLIPPGFELNIEQVVAPGQSKVKPHYSEEQLVTNDGNQPKCVTVGRRLESITIGSMPNRQVIIYDKRRATIQKRALFWFDAWGLNKDDKPNVYRVELRAGKNELKQTWGITTFADFEAGIGDVYTHAAEKVRYLADCQTDSNISRHKQHPLWDAVQQTVQEKLLSYRSGLCPGQVKEVIRLKQAEMYFQQMQGLAAGLSVVLGIPEADIPNFPERLAGILGKRITEPGNTFGESRNRAAKRLRFIA